MQVCVCVIVCNSHFICVTPLCTPTALVHYFSLLIILLFCRGNLLDLDKYSICHYEHMQTMKFTWVRPLTMRDNTHSKIITKFTRFRSHDKNIQFRERHSVQHSRKIISIYWKISIFSGKFFFFAVLHPGVYAQLCVNHTMDTILFYIFNVTKTFNHDNAINSEKYLWYGLFPSVGLRVVSVTIARTTNGFGRNFRARWEPWWKRNI